MQSISNFINMWPKTTRDIVNKTVT